MQSIMMNENWSEAQCLVRNRDWKDIKQQESDLLWTLW